MENNRNTIFKFLQVKNAYAKVWQRNVAHNIGIN